MSDKSLKYILTLLFFTIVLSAKSQENMSVESFALDPYDTTATLNETMRTDVNDQKAALIKIETTQKGFTFNTGLLGIVEVEQQNDLHPAEIWLYVPKGVKTLSIQHNILGVINQYDLGQSLQSGKTYRMKLTTNQVNQLVLDYNNQKDIKIEVEPYNSEVYLNGVVLPQENNGIYIKKLPVGTHHYRVTADNYHPQEGSVAVTEDASKNNLKIRLNQAFGYLTIPSTPETVDAEVFIDNAYKGKIPIEDLTVKSGEHSLIINKKLYKPFTTSFVMRDSAFVRPEISLLPNYAVVDFLIGDKDVDIYDNGNLIHFENNQLSTKLEDGHHVIEVKKPGHEPTEKEIDVRTGIRQSVGLESPHPIYGYLNVTSNPSDADVIINGQNYGTTPLLNQRMIIGDYVVEVEKKGFKTEKADVTVSRDKIERLEVKLNGYCTSYVLSSPTNANVYINDVFAGTTPHQLNLFTGKYDLRVELPGYLEVNKKVDLSALTPDLSFKLKKNLVNKNEFYFQAGYNILGLQGINIGAGLYYSNVNAELNYVIGIKKSESIYWNSLISNYAPDLVEYTPSAFNFKVGYGLGILGHFRITPQAGFQVVTLKEKNLTGSGIYLDKANSTSITLGAKLEYYPVNHFSVALSPGYEIPVAKSEGYKTLYDLSSEIKKYNSGFGLNASLKVYF